MKYWGYDDEEHVGELIVNKSLAKEVVQIFVTLHKNKFPIQQMKLTNPYLNKRKNLVLPRQVKEFADRSMPAKGKITKDSEIYKLSTDRG